MEIEKKDKVKKILTRVWLGVTTFLSGLFVVAVAVGCSQKGNKQSSAYYDESEYQYSYRYDYHKEYRNTQKAVVYNDEEYEITLSAHELNNYVWNNFNDACYQIQSTEGNQAIISDFDYPIVSLDTIVVELEGSENEHYYIDLVLQDTSDDIGYITFNYRYSTDEKLNHNKFEYADTNYDVIDFEYSFTFSCYPNVYNSIKSAIQADIQANSVNPGTDFVNDIFTDMTSAIVGFTGSVGSGIVAMTALFYDSVNSQLTTLGLLSVIVVAVSLAYWLFRLIIGLIRMRG